jgi:hypothetical protein
MLKEFEEQSQSKEDLEPEYSDFESELYDKHGFEELSPKLLRRNKVDTKSYDVYSDEENFESIVTDSIISALNEGKIKSPYKIVNTHSRMPDILVSDDLELVQESQDSSDEQVVNEETAGETKVSEKATEEAADTQNSDEKSAESQETNEGETENNSAEES